MRLFGYYAVHSFLNQLKKLFKTWVLIFIVACVVFGGLIGFGAATIANLADSNEPDTAQEEIEEPEKPPLIEKEPLIELIAGGVILALFVFEAISADKNGSRIFLPADVSLLFPSPMKPQTVLMFRLMTQLGLALFASVYMLFQLPNLTLNLGLGIWAALAVIGAWGLALISGKLIQVLLYTVCSTHAGLKKNLRRGVYVVVLLIAAGFVFFWKTSGAGPLEAAQRFFNAPASRYIPLWGWIKGFLMFAVEGRTAPALICLAASLVACAALILIIWNVKADFYEDAMAKSEETAELLEQARTEKSGGVAFRKRKKDRSEKLRRDGLNRGAGANIFFYKSLYNRFRFAHFGFLTKTMETYLLAAAAAALLCRYVIGFVNPIPVVLILAAFAFFRALGNPLEQDTKMDWFVLIPERTGEKLFWSLMGGTVNCLLDVLPALILGILLLWTNPFPALAWLPFIVSIDFYATTVGAFINLSVPVSAGKTLKQFVQILFIYFGLIPDIAILAIAIITHHTALGAVIAAVLNIALGFLFFALCPRYIDPPNRNTAAVPVDRSAPALPAYSAEPFAAPTETGSVQLGIARRNFSRMGGGLSLFMAVYIAFSLILSTILSVVREDWMQTAWLWVVNFAPQYLIALPLAMLLIRRSPRFPIEKKSLRPSVMVKAVFISVFLMLAGSLLGQFVNGVLGALIGKQAANPLDALLGNDSMILQILLVAVIGPIIEEFIFRKQLIGRMHAYGEKLAVVTSAALFALFHGNFGQAFYAFLLGLVFGYVYLRSGKLWYSCALHMLINLFGGVVSPMLLESAQSAASLPLDQLDIDAIAGMATPGLVILGLYEIVLIGSAIAGLVLLCLNARRLRFEHAALELPQGTRFRTAWVNFGMILFVVICLGLFVMTLFN